MDAAQKPTVKEMFARRSAWERSPSSYSALVMQMRQEGRPLIDLTSSNPAACGLRMDTDKVLSALNNPRALLYEPDSLGSPSARQAVCRYYASKGIHMTAEDLVLTASTSEAYSHLFRLLCDSGDAVLVAQPSYPLFEYLADLSDVCLQSFPLFYDHGWWIDRASLETAITPRTRALILVNPNNPTGHVTTPSERLYLQAFCLEHGLALIVDEVFLDYPHDPHTRLHSFAEGDASPVLTFVLNGLSKIAALPQMKVGWMSVSGPAALRAEALARLEIIADTFLSVNTPAQLALGAWLEEAPLLQQAILKRIRENLALLRGSGLRLLSVEAGWSVILKLPRLFIEEDAATELLSRGLMTHPASFYGLEDPACIVLSLIVPAAAMENGIATIENWLCLRTQQTS